MARDWDAYYSDPANSERPPEPLLVQVVDMMPPGRALDLACGSGNEALYLAHHHWQVTAVDSSKVALRLLRERAGGLAVDARFANLEKDEFEIEPATYDLICDFQYLQRDLFAPIRTGIKPGGVFAGSIHVQESARPSTFVVQPGELQKEFEGWKIVFYSEAEEPGGWRPSARIIARKPS